MRTSLLPLGLLLLCATARAAEPEEEPPAPELQVGGALRYNAVLNTWNEDLQRRFGDILFDTFRFNVDGSWRGILVSAEYRFYAGFQMLHHGWVGYQFSDDLVVEAGVNKVPFGLLPFASHNWFFDLPYYVGLEDDYDLGLKGRLRLGQWGVQLAFYKSDEGSYLGSSLDSARYSYDVVQVADGSVVGLGDVGPVLVEEVNQANARVAWTEAWEEGSLELGLSGQLGGLYDAATGQTGTHWAAAAHVDFTWRGLNVQLEGLHLSHAPPGVLAGGPVVLFGAYDAPYRVARRAYGWVANVAYLIPTPGWGPIESVRVYNDFSWLAKLEEGFGDSFQDVLGAVISAGPLITYVDLAAGRNHPFLGPDYTVALAEGGAEARWELRFNINLGYYF